jgi:hypothetical protein
VTEKYDKLKKWKKERVNSIDDIESIEIEEETIEYNEVQCQTDLESEQPSPHPEGVRNT